MVNISLDISLVIQLINFLLLILALNVFLYRPIRKILAERNALFTRLKDKAAQAKAEIENGEAEKERLHAESVRKALSRKNDIVLKSKEQEKSIVTEAQEKAERQIEDARKSLQQALSKAREELNSETREIAKEMAGKVLGRSLN